MAGKGKKTEGDEWFDNKTDKLVDDLKMGTDEESDKVKDKDK